MAIFALAGLLISYHLRFSWFGLSAGFTFDDLMNLGRAIQFGWSEALCDTVLFAKPSHLYRPVGALFYRLIHSFAGADPQPYRIACHALIGLNGLLAFALFHRLSGRVAVAALAVIPLVHHPERQLFYVNSGYCYDLLCFAFTMAALLVYAGARARGHEVTGLRLAWFSGLFVLALGSKEVAVAIPVTILAYELVTPGRWSRRRTVPLLVTGGAVAIFLAGRVLSEAGLAAIGNYAPQWDAGAVLRRMRDFVEACCLLPGWAGLGLTALALFARQRAAVTGLALAVAAELPVAVLERPFEASYLASAGWSLAAAVALVWFINRLTCPLLQLSWTAALLFLVALTWFWTQSTARALNPRAALEEGRRISRISADLRALRLDLRPPARVFFVEDPFPESRYATTFLLTILSSDPGGSGETIRVDWASEGARYDPAQHVALLTTIAGRVRRLE